MSADELDRIARSFHRHRASYDASARPQRVIARMLARRLQSCAGPRDFGRVLEFGAGSYHFSRALDARFSISELWLNDLAPHPLPDDLRGNSQLLPGPIERAIIPTGLDLVASASTIQWLAGPAQALSRLCANVRPGGWLAVSGFGPRQFHQIVSLTGPDACAPALMDAATLAQALPDGWQIHDCAMVERVQSFASPQAMLAHLRLTGVNGLAKKGWTRRDLAQFCSQYQHRFATPSGGVGLCWNPVWMIARRL